MYSRPAVLLLHHESTIFALLRGSINLFFENTFDAAIEGHSWLRFPSRSGGGSWGGKPQAAPLAKFPNHKAGSSFGTGATGTSSPLRKNFGPVFGLHRLQPTATLRRKVKAGNVARKGPGAGGRSCRAKVRLICLLRDFIKA